MVCDKCKRRNMDQWIPGGSYPKFLIAQDNGIEGNFPIHLCRECSKKFSQWLDEKDGGLDDE